MKKIISAIAAAVVSLLIYACGGGGGGGSSGPVTPIPTPITLRTDLLYGYYGANPTQINETYTHVNVYMTYAWFQPDFIAGLIAELGQAKAMGVNTFMVGLLASHSPDKVAAENYVRMTFTHLRGAGLLENVKYIYPIDEPDIRENGPKTDQEVVEVNAMIRRVAAEFPELAGVKLAVIYGGDDEYYPGLSSYDMVGIDHYDVGPGVTSLMNRLKLKLRPDQCMIVVPGGANGVGSQDPTPFFNYAQTEPRVCMLMPFIWFDYWNTDGVKVGSGSHLGIKSNGQANAYCVAGKKIKQPHVPTPVCSGGL